MSLMFGVKFVGVQCRVSRVPINYHVLCFGTYCNRSAQWCVRRETRDQEDGDSFLPSRGATIGPVFSMSV